jgi:glycine dehydrogenase subunit 2
MFEPTETESVQTLEALAQALERIAQRAHDDPEPLHHAPQSTPVSRVDEARAARRLIATADAER